MANGQKQFADPFAQFLAEAYLKGAMPGGQNLSNYNTVLDLLSPSAMSDRAEQGVPDAAEYFANMFGGTPPLPDELTQAMQVQMGIAPSQKNLAEVQSAVAKAQGEIGKEQVKAQQAQREFESSQLFEADKFTQEQALARETLESEDALRRAQAAKAEAEAAAMGQLTPQEQQAMLDLDIDSRAMFGLPWDFAKGGPIEVAVTPDNAELVEQAKVQNQMMAQKFLAAKQADPQGLGVVSALLNNGQPQAAFLMLERNFPGMFTIQDIDWFTGLFPGSPTHVLRPNMGGGVSLSGAGLTQEQNNLIQLMDQSLEQNRQMLQQLNQQ
jgi:hypothetical protein